MYDIKIYKGTSRVVVTFPALHVAVKFPIIRAIIFTRSHYRIVSKRTWINLIMWKYPSHFGTGFRFMLFAGIMANLREAFFYLHTRHPFLQPTYFSLLGLVNIQRYDEIRVMKSESWKQFMILTDQEMMLKYHDGHHFEPGNGNFSVRDGKLRIHDYGSPKTQKVVESWGMRIMEGFKLGST